MFKKQNHRQKKVRKHVSLQRKTDNFFYQKIKTLSPFSVWFPKTELRQNQTVGELKIQHSK